VAAATDSVPRPRTSIRFSPPRPRLDGTGWQALPSPLLPNHPRLANRVAGVADGDPTAALELAADGELSWADIATVARAYCELGDTKAADSVIGLLDEASPDAAGLASTIGTARSYLHGISALAAGDAPRAAVLLADAYATAPGEAACALSYAAAVVATGDATRLEEAADVYEQVAVADPTWVVAVAGLARALNALGRSADAARVLTAVPEGHPLRAQALTEASRAMEPGPYDPQVAAAAAAHLRSDRSGRRGAADAELAVALYGSALAALRRGESVGASVGGVEARPEALARAAEEALLDLADNTPDAARRHELLDMAARTRPWSVW
jgi:hypothetical protein